jgi:formylglycine-generating enzyme
MLSCGANGKWSGAVSCAVAVPYCYAGSCMSTAPSCLGIASVCGATSKESCCTNSLVTGGTFNRSNDANYPATVSSFRLDKFEVTVNRFRKFVEAVEAGWRPTTGAGKHTHLNNGKGLANSGAAGFEGGWDAAWTEKLPNTKDAWSDSLSLCSGTTWSYNAGPKDAYPVNCVDWYQAHAFCIWDGGFLPSEAEWNYAAAGGGEQRFYPWSSPATSTTIDCTYANYSSCNGVTAAAAVGASSKGAGRYGQMDLAGNVYEWNLDWYGAPYPTPCTDCAYLKAGTNRVERGFSLTNQLADYMIFATARTSVTPSTKVNYTGLRCARMP